MLASTDCVIALAATTDARKKIPGVLQEHRVRVEEIDTPALLVSLDAMEANLHRMASFFHDKPAKLRPHYKNHRVPLLALKQLQAGAIGITCATLREAESLVNHGVDNILIANEIAGSMKAMQLAELSSHASIIIAIDSRSAAKDLARAQRNSKVSLNVVVDVDLGMDRCGVQMGEPAIQLAKFAVDQGLRFRGLMGYDGHLQALTPSRYRDDLVRTGSGSLVHMGALIKREGIPVDIISTGATGTYDVSGAYPGITEIQAGSYLLMDTLHIDRGSNFQQSLSVLATIISKHNPHRAVIDCGVKAISTERGFPQLKDINGIQVKTLHAVHGLLEIESDQAAVEVGRKIELWVHYGDATMNLHDRVYGIRNGEVEEVLRIEH